MPSVPTLETEASLLKSWDFTLTKHTNVRSLSERKKPYNYKFLEMSDQKARKDGLPLVCITDDFDNKEHLYDLSSNFETDRRFNIDEELSLKQSPMPYLHYSNEKRIFHTPFKWVFNQAQAQQINTESFYIIKEVAISNASTKQGERNYQIQPNGQKIEEIQEQIEVAFQLYWKLTMYHRIRTNFSVEINKLYKVLQEISPKILIEGEYIYDANSYILFTNNNIDEQIYNEYKNLLEPIIGTKMIPVLAKLKKELYAMEYLSWEYKDIHAKLDILLKNLNQTIAVAGIMKKNADKNSRLSSLNLQAALKLEKMQSPHELYKSFQEIAVRIQTLTSDLNRFSKLRVGFRTYLKIAVILDIYLPQENKLKELKKKLFVINEQLSHKAQYFKGKGYLRRIGSISAGTEYFIEEFDVDFKSLFEGNQCLEQNMVTEMKDHMQRVEKFVNLAEIFCGEIKSTKDHVKVFKMHHDSIIYLQQVEQITRGIHLAKKIKEELEPILGEEDDALLQEDLMRNIEHEYRDLALQVRLSNFSTDNQSWSSPKIATAFIQALEQELQVKRGKKGKAKAIAFGKRKMLSKLAKIVRRRIKEMNRIYISCRRRINSHIRIKDAIKFLKSKRLWRALSSDKSCILSVQGNIEGCKKAVNHKIYCNAELEMNLMKIIRVFVFLLANVMPTI